MKTENWRAVLEAAAKRTEQFGAEMRRTVERGDQMRSTGQILAGMMRRGMLDALDERSDGAETMRDV